MLDLPFHLSLDCSGRYVDRLPKLFVPAYITFDLRLGVAALVVICQESDDPRLEHDLAVLKGKPVLTVNNLKNAALRGVMIRFLTEPKIRLRINLGAVRAANLSISSKLLRAAEIVASVNK